MTKAIAPVSRGDSCILNRNNVAVNKLTREIAEKSHLADLMRMKYSYYIRERRDSAKLEGTKLI